jgi:hypothetical protein
MKFKALTAALAIFLFAFIGCHRIEDGIYSNEKIPSKTALEAKNLHELIVKAVQQDKPHVIEGLISDHLTGAIEEVHPFIDRVGKIIQEQELTILEMHHIMQTSGKGGVEIKGSENTEKAYKIRFQPLTDESIIMVSKAVKDGDEYRLFLFLGKYGEYWKLNALDFGRITLAGKDAIDYFNAANEAKDKGHLIHAINRMVIATSLLSPAPSYWNYEQEETITLTHEALINQAMEVYPMPYKVDEVSTQPELFKIMPQRVEDKICAMIKYRSQINLSDTNALKAENQMLQQFIGTKFTGIDQEVPFVFYRVYNEIPKEGITVPYYGFVQKTGGLKIN